ncbi:MAG: hypothetical protein AB7T06_37065 [Kofleriaceae bacterium]
MLDAPIAMCEHQRRRLAFGDRAGAAREIANPPGIGLARLEQLAVRLREHAIAREREALQCNGAILEQLNVLDEAAREHRSWRRIGGWQIGLDRREARAQWQWADERLRAWKASRVQRALRGNDSLERGAIEWQVGIGCGRWFRFDDDLAAIIEPDAVNAADARRLKQVASDRGVQRAANERIDRGEDALRIAGGEDVELDERRPPLRELFGDDGNKIAHGGVV